MILALCLEGVAKQRARKKSGGRAKSGEDCHPEVSNEALPEERSLFFWLGRVEVEEEGTERKFQEKTHIENGKSEDARREEGAPGEETAYLVVGGELEMEESDAQTEATTAAVPRLHIFSEQLRAEILKEGRLFGWSELRLSLWR